MKMQCVYCELETNLCMLFRLILGFKCLIHTRYTEEKSTQHPVGVYQTLSNVQHNTP